MVRAGSGTDGVRAGGRQAGPKPDDDEASVPTDVRRRTVQVGSIARGDVVVGGDWRWRDGRAMGEWRCGRCDAILIDDDWPVMPVDACIVV